MNVTEHHHAPTHYLLNTDLIDASIVTTDLSLFESNPATGAPHNDNGRGTVYFRSLKSHSGSIPVVVKQYRRGGMVRHLNKNLYWHSHYSQSRVWLEFKLLVKMTTMGLPVPMPVAGRVKRRFLQWYEASLITQEIEQSITFADSLKQRLGNADDQTLWNNVGATIKRFHTANIYHADLNASNILVTETDHIYLIDFDKGRYLPDSKTDWKKSNLERLQRSLLKYQSNNDQFQFSAKHWQALIAGYEHQSNSATL